MVQLPLHVSSSSSSYNNNNNTNNFGKNIFLVFFSSTKADVLFYFLFSLSVVLVAMFKHDLSASSSCCDTLLTDGYWQSSFLPLKSTETAKSFEYQPLGCTMQIYSQDDLIKCSLETRHFLFIGDSHARLLWRNSGGFSLEGGSKWANRHWTVSDHSLFSFIWDPYLNQTKLPTTSLPSATTSTIPDISAADNDSRELVFIISTGHWFMKNIESIEDGMARYEEALDRIFAISKGKVYIVPPTPLIENNLAKERTTLSNSLVRKYSNLLGEKYISLAENTNDSQRRRFHLLSSYKHIFSTDTAKDGLHYDDKTYTVASNIVLNHVCNRDLFSGRYPLKTTCCTDYAPINWRQILVFFFFFYLGPFALFYNYITDKFSFVPIWPLHYMPSMKNAKHISVFSVGLAAMFMADRTHLFLKRQKYFDPISFATLLIFSGGIGYISLQTSKDSSFLNRELTDEWKGWMQIFILVYHYTGASSISPIYNFARILVASYLFMTGYGHFIYFYKKKDFGYARVLKVLIRLNLLAIALTYIMEYPFQSYYFSPLVSLWFLVIYVVMIFMNSMNTNGWFMLGKFATICLLVLYLSRNYALFSGIVRLFVLLFGADLNIKELHFRIFLDMFIVIFGMLCGYIFVKHGTHVADILQKYEKSSFWIMLVSSFTGLTWYIYYESSKNKFDYNAYHPVISIVPITTYIICRNLTTKLRQTSSMFFTFFGKISLETFVIQFHIWLAMDTKGLLDIVPSMPALNFLITSFMFIYLSHTLSIATNDLTEYLAYKAKDSRYQVISFVVALMILNHIPVNTVNILKQ